MNSNLYHGIVFVEHDPLLRKSCIIFREKYCIAPASILLTSFNRIQDEIRAIAKHDMHRDLKHSRIIDTVNDKRYHSLAKYNFKVIHEHNDTLYESDAFIVNLFKCRNIWNTFNDILPNFVAKPAKHTPNNDLHTLLLSSFVILRLKIGETDNHHHTTNTTTDTIDSTNIFEDIRSSISKEHNANDRQPNVHMHGVRKMEYIESVSTPFGNECFLNTINVGRIANIFGNNKCLMVASMPLVNGCEGGAIYNRNQDLVGIVISTTFDWNNENATLTLVARFSEIIAEFVEQSQLTTISIDDVPRNCDTALCKPNARNGCSAVNCTPPTNPFEDFIVLIQGTNAWGSGCFVKINEFRMVITCAHVLDKHNGDVRCTWKFGTFNSEVIFKNPDYDVAYDIAILEAPANVPEQYFTQCYTTQTKIGQLIYSSGFPHFTSLGKVREFFPSIFEGRVTKLSNGVIFTDASVQSGQSGGPMFSADGCLIGICVSNSKDDAYELIYPNVNMSIPVYDILPVLQKYGQTKGKHRHCFYWCSISP